MKSNLIIFACLASTLCLASRCKAESSEAKYCIATCKPGRHTLAYRSGTNSLPFTTVDPPKPGSYGSEGNPSSTFVLTKPDGSRIERAGSVFYTVCAPGVPGGPPPPCGLTIGYLSFAPADITDQVGRYTITSSNPIIRGYAFDVVQMAQADLLIENISGYKFLEQAINPEGTVVSARYQGITDTRRNMLVSVSIKDSAAAAQDFYNKVSGARAYPKEVRDGQALNVNGKSNPGNVQWVSDRYYVQIHGFGIYGGIDPESYLFIDEYLKKYPSSVQ